MKQPGNVVVVIPDSKTIGDEIADHRAGPHAARVSRNLRPVLYQLDEFGLLLFAELGRSPWRLPGPQPINSIRFVPTEPPVD